MPSLPAEGGGEARGHCSYQKKTTRWNLNFEQKNIFLFSTIHKDPRRRLLLFLFRPSGGDVCVLFGDGSGSNEAWHACAQ